VNNKTLEQKYTPVKFMTDWGVVAAIVVAFAIFSVAAPSVFFNTSNVINILRSISITTIIALGATFCFSAGIFDLSFATTATIGAMFSVTFMAWYGIPMIPALLLTVLSCMVIGVINSFVVIKLRVPAFLATLAMSFVLDGFAVTYSGASVINPTVTGARGQEIVMQIPEAFRSLGRAPAIIIIMFVCIILADLFQSHTKHGRFLYVVGSNAEAGRLSGIRINRYRTLAFLLATVFSAIGGILIASRAGTVQAGVGTTFLMPSIAALNIGVALAGKKKANAWGTFVGAALVGVIENGLYAVAFPYYAIAMVRGAILLAALIMSYYSNKE